MNDEEPRIDEPIGPLVRESLRPGPGSLRPNIDPALVNEVIAQTHTINHNLVDILSHTDTVIRRQNVLTILFILSLACNGLQLVLGFSMQTLQHSAREQLIAVDQGRSELLMSVQGAKQEVQNMQESLAGMKTQLQSVPTVTTDSKGRINLEVPLDTAAQKTVAEQPQVVGDTRAPDKLVIPLRPSQSRLAN